MKKTMQFAFGACLALTLSSASAQKEERFKDTITISPTKDFMVMMVGHGINKMIKNNKFDSLKTLFVADWEQATAQNNYPINAKNTYYFVSPNGKRRLKSESEDYQTAIDIEKEKKNIIAGLPAFQYIIFDMTNDFEYHIYSNDPQKISLLKDLSATDILSKHLTDKKNNNRNFRVDIVQENNQWKPLNQFPAHNDFLLLSPSLGAAMIGSKFSPTVGGSIYVQFGNKYGTPNFKVGLASSAYILSDYSNKQFTNVYTLADYEARFLRNINQFSNPSKPLWLGVNFGVFDGNKKGELHKSLKGGFTMQYKDLEYSFNFIQTKNSNKDFIYGLSVKFLF